MNEAGIREPNNTGRRCVYSFGGSEKSKVKCGRAADRAQSWSGSVNQNGDGELTARVRVTWCCFKTST
jgi:hypothetical protein